MDFPGKLFPHQIAALDDLNKWFMDPNKTNHTAVVVMPTGSGKSGVICCLPYSLAAVSDKIPGGLDLGKPVLIIAPDLNIQDQLDINLHSVPTAKRDMPFLVKYGIVPSEYQSRVLPQVYKVDDTKALRDDILKSSEIVLTNAQKWHSRERAIWEDLPGDIFSVVIVDEAHHLPALTWKRVVDKFNHAKVVFMTATPCRADGQNITETFGGKIQLAHHLKRNDAIAQNIIRKVEFTELKPNSPAEGKPPSLPQIQQSILEAVSEQIKKKNSESPLPGGKRHVAIAVAGTIKEATDLTELWNEKYGATAAAYTGETKKFRREEILKQLEGGQVQLLVIVQMLLEGFDHPPISVAAVATHITSLTKFAQFIGRAQRVVRTPEGVEQGGVAHVITHEHFKQSGNWDAFLTEKYSAVS